MFEQASGFENSPIKTRLLWNILGPSLRRIALTLEEPTNTPTVELIRRTKDKLKRRIPPREVDDKVEAVDWPSAAIFNAPASADPAPAPPCPGARDVTGLAFTSTSAVTPIMDLMWCPGAFSPDQGVGGHGGGERGGDLHLDGHMASIAPLRSTTSW